MLSDQWHKLNDETQRILGEAKSFGNPRDESPWSARMLRVLTSIGLAAAGLTSAAWNEQCILPAFAETVSTAANLSPQNALEAIEASASCQ